MDKEINEAFEKVNKFANRQKKKVVKIDKKRDKKCKRAEKAAHMK